MNIELNIDDDLMGQFSAQLNAPLIDNSIVLKSSIGEINIKWTPFPNSLEFYHFTFNLQKPLQLSSHNPENSEYLLLNINLSEKSVEKTVNGKNVDVQKYLPSGILYYPPNTKVKSTSPINTEFEIVLIRLRKHLLSDYTEGNQNYLLEIKDSIIYEDLDFKSEELLRMIIESDSKIKKHAHTLNFLSLFYEKLSRRKAQSKYDNLLPDETKQLFLTASLLRNPTNKNIPSVDDLAKLAGMSKTKFKNLFKQVFGKPPKQYHRKIVMEYAKDELQAQRRSSSELAYELGYADPSKFTRAFKSYFGSTPSQV